MRPLTLVILLSLATYRATRLVVSDTFPPVEKLRAMIVGEDESKHEGTRLAWLDELLTCNWCASFWVSGIVVVATDLFTSVPLPFLLWWSVAGLGAFILFLEDTLYVIGVSHARQASARNGDALRRVI